MDTQRNERGVALISVMMLIALLMILLAGYYALSRIETSTTKSSLNSFRGFYAAEAGLNLRAGLVTQTFQGFSQPAGESPDLESGTAPCAEGNDGSGDFACVSYALQNRAINTYVVEASNSPSGIIIPRGEIFQNLSAREYGYAVYSQAFSPKGPPEALLELHFRSRVASLFEFAAFFNKDLEILPTEHLTFIGPVHSNGDLYLGTPSEMTLYGQVTAAGEIYNGRKDSDTCLSGPIEVADPDDLVALPACSAVRRLYDPDADGLDAWEGMIQAGISPVTVPPAEAIWPQAGGIYWDRADGRIVLDLDVGEIQVRNQDGTKNVGASTLLAACGAVSASNSLYNNREAAMIQMLDVDLKGLFDCIHSASVLEGGKSLSDTTDGGLVLFLSVDGANSSGINNYGVRLTTGEELAATTLGAPAIQGLTVVTDQALYVQGDFNTVNKKPAAFLADSLNVLSNNWSDANSTLALSSRPATSTTIHAAMLAGTDTTGGVDGDGGQDAGNYSGGLENFARLHENWSGDALLIRGSLVSLSEPAHVDGAWAYGGTQYLPPTRALLFDEDLRDPALQPPLTPQFVYLRQELFVRQF